MESYERKLEINTTVWLKVGKQVERVLSNAQMRINQREAK